MEPGSVGAPQIALSDGGKTATLTYALERPTEGNAWPKGGVGEVSIAAGAFQRRRR